METKRKLPVLKDPEDEGPSRPPYQWVGFGAVAILVAWLPLASLVGRLTGALAISLVGQGVDTTEDLATAIARLDTTRQLELHAAFVGLHAGGLAIAATVAGFLVGRWGGAAGVREATASAILAVAIVTALSAVSGGFSWTALAALPVAALFAAIGARFGRGRRTT